MLIYQTTLTQKGQITIPKHIRDILKLSPTQRVRISLGANKKTAVIEPADDFIAVAKSISTKQKSNPVDARQALEHNYGRA